MPKYPGVHVQAPTADDCEPWRRGTYVRRVFRKMHLAGISEAEIRAFGAIAMAGGPASFRAAVRAWFSIDAAHDGDTQAGANAKRATEELSPASEPAERSTSARELARQLAERMQD